MLWDVLKITYAKLLIWHEETETEKWQQKADSVKLIFFKNDNYI